MESLVQVNRRVQATSRAVTKPRISVITPTLNAGATIENAILSVANQTYDQVEHWIIDGGSTDATLAIVAICQERFPRIRVQSRPDRSPYEAMNRGIDCATGDWIYFLGADDVLFTDAIFSELYEEGYLEKDGLVYGNVFVVGEGSWTGDGTVYDGEFDLQKLFNKNICHQAILYPAHLVRRIGYFKHKYFVTSDWEYNIRCAAFADLIHVDKVIAKFASGGISSSGRNDGFAEDLGRTVEKYYAPGNDLAARRRTESSEWMNPKPLWADGRPVNTCDDLLLELFGRPIVNEVRTLYIVGAHLFQERKLLFRLFPLLEKVYLFEPLPDVAVQLRAIVAGDPAVEVFQYAISDRDERAALHVADNNGESSSLLRMGAHARVFPWVHEAAVIEVQAHSLGAVIEKHSLRIPDMLFLDVQGAEFRILSTLPDELRCCIKLIYTECSKEEIYQGARPLEDVQSVLLPEFLFMGFAPLMQTSPTHGNALFVHRHYAYAMEKEPPELALPGTEWSVTGDNRPTRNAPCPCGSGRRYRSCHGSLG